MKPVEIVGEDEWRPEGEVGDPTLLGRKSVMMGLAASMGFVFGNAGHPSSAAAATVKPSSIAAGQPAYAPKWTPYTSYVLRQQVISPNNDVVSAKVAHKSLGTFAADVVNWNLSPTFERDTPGVYYVDPVRGDDNNSGGVWGSAFATVAAAIAAAASGDTINLARGIHDVIDGLVIPLGKVLNLIGPPLGARQYGFSGAVICSSRLGAQRPAWLVDLQSATASNSYGCELRNLVLDVRGVTAGGIRARNRNHVQLTNIYGVVGTDTADGRMLVDARVDITKGDDCSWWRLTNVQTLGLPLGLFGDLASGGGNYLTVLGSVLHCPLGTTALKVTGSQPTIVGVTIEGPSVGVELIGCRGGWIAPTGESVGAMVKLTDTRDALVLASSSAGAGSSAVVEAGTSANNIIIGASQANGIQRTGAAVGSVVVSPRYGNPLPYVAANQLMVLANDFSTEHFGHELPPAEAMSDALLAVPLVVEYWTGASWAKMPGANPGLLSVPTFDGITLTSTYRRIRVRNTTPAFGSLSGLAWVRYDQGADANTVITLRTKDAALFVLSEQTLTLPSPGNAKGLLASTPQGGDFLELEIETNLTGANTAQLTRFSLLTATLTFNQEGRPIMRGTFDPEGLLSAMPGDVYRRVGQQAANGDGLYLKRTGWGDKVGWARMPSVADDVSWAGTQTFVGEFRHTGTKFGAFGAAAVSKPTGTPANATDLASAVALVNDLKAKLVALGWVG